MGLRSDLNTIIFQWFYCTICDKLRNLTDVDERLTYTIEQMAPKADKSSFGDRKKKKKINWVPNARKVKIKYNFFCFLPLPTVLNTGLMCRKLTYYYLQDCGDFNEGCNSP